MLTVDALRRLFTMRQSDKECIAEFIVRFKNELLTVRSYCCADIWFDGIFENVTKQDFPATKKCKGLSDDKNTQVRTTRKELTEATLFLSCTNKGNFGNLLTDLKNDYVKGNNTYQKDMVAAPFLVNNYKVEAAIQATPATTTRRDQPEFHTAMQSEEQRRWSWWQSWRKIYGAVITTSPQTHSSPTCSNRKS